MVLGTFKCVLKMDDCKEEDQTKAFHIPFLAVALIDKERLHASPMVLGKSVIDILGIRNKVCTEEMSKCGEEMLEDTVYVQNGLGGVRGFDSWKDFEKEYRIIAP